MKKFLKKKLGNEKGMTLIELLAVIVILAIIAAIAIPAIGNIIENSRVGAVKSDAINVMAAADLYFTDGNTGTVVTMTQLKAGKYLDNGGSFEAAGAAEPSVTRATTTTPASIGGTGVAGNVKIVFTTATRANINAVKNSDRNQTAGTPVVVTVN
ncbi:prepilin-type N-terminal cleavage/methylation domain-containing protein [Planococcus halotolerans]|uniref:Tfp assembly type protein n=1 Tax=Planococcus halotolerans TaxID=2233542 RepID=A0A365KTN8_9BACL|nr:prepilin-type N-terminal cleavage/methylation domain-containing protein [Planococcus halotolerans]QHJ71588.1 prepilin-type N-terminal cleavage/methylation domain-containing protein [Planococcus halotolerans]RAZ76556.1 Tfp assembly type protein [Planococcus halotolerans]